jgi:hypothetical protein
VPTSALAQIDITRLVFDKPTADMRGNNLTKTLSFTGFYDKTASAAPLALTVKSLVAALP